MSSRRILGPGLVVFLWAAIPAFPLFAQQARWEESNKEAISLYQQGKYVEGQAIANEALQVAEASFGLGHPNVATSLENYAALLGKTNRATEAEQIESRAKAIRAKQATKNP